ncbi:MAG TPA: NADH-quinone oxidoreductase subunit NuoE [Bacillota bacterium]|nr:NADH-quinone oxidoreductase subunit NuoE [Bacillota bacterium]
MAMVQEKLSSQFEEGRLKEVDAVILRHRDRPGALLAILTEIQNIFGYLPETTFKLVAQALGIPLSQIWGVATFYTLFNTRPRGRHMVRLCENAPCHIQGAASVREAIERELGIVPGEDTQDGKWSLELVSCLGICGVAPALMIDDQVYGNVRPEAVAAILASHR